MGTKSYLEHLFHISNLKYKNIYFLLPEILCGCQAQQESRMHVVGLGTPMCPVACIVLCGKLAVKLSDLSNIWGD